MKFLTLVLQALMKKKEGLAIIANPSFFTKCLVAD